MADSLDTLSDAAGIDREGMLGLWAEVKANHAKLESCHEHDFRDDPRSDRLFSRKFFCSNCGGWADAHAVHWYQKGLARGRRGQG